MQEIQDSVKKLEDLANLLIDNRKTSRRIVIPLIGAGASVVAGLPTSNDLKYLIYKELASSSHPDGSIRNLLDMEAVVHFGEKAQDGILKLSLFEFAAVVSQFAYGRDAIHKVLQHILHEPSRRPLAYELLAHLTKHRFINHIVSLNFDSLLDEALKDELPDRLYSISSTDEVPGRHAANELVASKCCLLKPFGSLGTDVFKLRPAELHKYGSDSIWNFLISHIFSKPSGDKKPEIVLVLVGYSAAEQAFIELLHVLKKSQKITIYVIDPVEEISSILFKNNAIHIPLEADTAFSILLEQMHQLSHKVGIRVWCPVARHNILSRYLLYQNMNDRRLKFQVEVILQAVKSRGFFTVNALCKLERVQKYSENAHELLSDLKNRGILIFHDSEDYELATKDHSLLAVKVLQLLGVNSEEVFSLWEVTVNNQGNITAALIQYSNVKYLAKQFEIIACAPEIEIYDTGWAATQWLFKDVTKLDSLENLTHKTEKMLNRFIGESSNNIIEIIGVWVTGEWLFHEQGWANMFGKQIIELVKAGRANMSIILIKPLQPLTLRYERAEDILKSLSIPTLGSITIYQMDWWQQNRKLTLIRERNKEGVIVAAEGIYMRRRLATPLVSPVHVIGEEDCNVLEKFFERYKRKDGTKIYRKE